MNLNFKPMNTIDAYVWSSFIETHTKVEFGQYFFSDFWSKIGFGCILGNFEEFLTQNGTRTKIDRLGLSIWSKTQSEVAQSTFFYKNLLLNHFYQKLFRNRSEIDQKSIRKENCPNATFRSWHGHFYWYQKNREAKWW